MHGMTMDARGHVWKGQHNMEHMNGQYWTILPIASLSWVWKVMRYESFKFEFINQCGEYGGANYNFIRA